MNLCIYVFSSYASINVLTVKLFYFENNFPSFLYKIWCLQLYFLNKYISPINEAVSTSTILKDKAKLFLKNCHFFEPSTIFMPGRKPLVRLFNNIIAFPVLLTLVIVYVNLEQEDTFMKLNNSISCFITVCVCV